MKNKDKMVAWRFILSLSVIIGLTLVGSSYAQNIDFKLFQPLQVKEKKGKHRPIEVEEFTKSYGHWVKVPEKGYVWRPTGVPARWNPLQEGHKVWNPAINGYVWESPNRPWGWLPLDYGQWELYAQTDWVWVPNQTHVVITPNGVSFHLDIGPEPFTVGPPPPVYLPEEEEEHHPRGHAYGHYKNKHKQKHDDDGEEED